MVSYVGNVDWGGMPDLLLPKPEKSEDTGLQGFLSRR